MRAGIVAGTCLNTNNKIKKKYDNRTRIVEFNQQRVRN